MEGTQKKNQALKTLGLSETKVKPCQSIVSQVIFPSLKEPAAEGAETCGDVWRLGQDMRPWHAMA